MPVIHIEYDNAKVDNTEAKKISEAIQNIVSEITGIEDVFVYARSAEIKIKIAPIEIFIRMSAHKISDADALIAKIKLRLSEWKQQNKFSHPVNLTLIPMQWKIEIGI